MNGSSVSSGDQRVDLAYVTSLYRSARFLPRFTEAALRHLALLDQHGVSAEVVVVANEPSFLERRWLVDFEVRVAAAGAGRARVLVGGREPLYASWNRGVHATNSRCVGFWNCDDTRNAQAAIEGIRLIDGGARLAYFPYVRLETRWPFRLGWNFSVTHCPVPSYSHDKFQDEMLAGPFFVAARNLFDDIGDFDERFRIAGDFDWCARAAAAGPLTRAEAVGGVYFQDGLGLSEGGDPRVAAEDDVVRLRQGRYDSLVPAPARLMREYRALGLLDGVDIPDEIEAWLFRSSADKNEAAEEWRRTRRRAHRQQQRDELRRLVVGIVGRRNPGGRAP